jgi:deazaflavin-dependent oxidoreductase (nitroreductase family)
MDERRYVPPRTADRLFNGLVALLARLGISIMGSRVLAVRGRKSGQWRTVPVNLLDVDGVRYLVAPRGETEWVRNLRASGTGELRLAARRETFSATELSDAHKPPILRAYIAKWWFEVKQFFDLADANAPDAELARVAPQHPVFRLDRMEDA